MQISITNQKPAEFYNPSEPLPFIPTNLPTSDFITKIIDDISIKMIDPLFTPITQNSPVKINDTTDIKNILPITHDMVRDAIVSLVDPDLSGIDIELDNQLNEIFRQSSQYHQNHNWLLEEILVVEALSKNKLPLPTTKGSLVKYTEDIDIIPTAKQLLSNFSDKNKELWFANMGAYLHDFKYRDILLVSVQTQNEFEEIKKSIDKQVSLLNQIGLPPSSDTNGLISNFKNLTFSTNIDLSISLLMQKQDDFISPTSFGRILMSAIADLQIQKNTNISHQPINLLQQYLPNTIVFINVERYAHANAQQIKNDWITLEKALNAASKLKIVSNTKLRTASSLANTLTSYHSKLRHTKNDDITRLAQRKFKGKPATNKQMLTAMINIVNKLMSSTKTSNVYKIKKPTYMRANRRNPNDINLMGKFQTKKYRPNIHLYIDTSGSINEPQYRDATINIILLAKKIKCDLYISSFSHNITQTYKLKTKGLSLNEIYKNFLAIPKTNGGTNYEVVWDKINKIDELNNKAGKSYEINFIITDFEYSISRNKRMDPKLASVKNTFYAPISTSPQSWNYILNYANEFADGMIKAGDTKIKSRILL